MQSINGESSESIGPPFLGRVAQEKSVSVQDDEILTVPDFGSRL
jgi:hypothetical protein